MTAAEGSEGTSALEVLRDSITEAATRARGLWLGYIALMTYLAISIGAVTHRDLLFESPVRLPVLNVELPLLGFFAVAPLFFLINHFYLLLILFGVSKRIQRFNAAVNEARLPTDAEDLERWRLPSFVIVQMLAGVEEDRTWGSLSGFFLWMIAWITLVVLPVFLILGFQLQFLPYHHQGITWLHRIVLVLDLAALWLFWPAIRHGQWTRLRGSAWRWVTAVILVPLSWGVLTFPGETADYWGDCDWNEDEECWRGVVKLPIFDSLPVHRTLSLPDEQLIDLAEFDKIRTRHKTFDTDLEPWEMSRTLSLRERDLKGGRFDRSDLRNVDLYGTSLQGASLDGAKLQGASLDFAQLQGASLDFANLQSTRLLAARLQGASLDFAQLQGASLEWASLQGASLEWASLQGASLDKASLQGASLGGAKLQGASLDRASLQGASLDGAYVNNTNFAGASVWRTIGLPQFDSSTPPWVKDIWTYSISTDEFESLLAKSMRNVESERTVEKIKKSLEVLSSTNESPPIDSIFFNSDSTPIQISIEKYAENLRIYITKLTCSEYSIPYIANMIVRNYLKLDLHETHEDYFQYNRHNRSLSFFIYPFAETLLTAAETKNPDCLGVHDLNATSLKILRDWVPNSQQ